MTTDGAIYPEENDPATPSPSPAFVNASEREFAQILDFYGIKWEYEPRSFPLQWDGDRVTEMIRPDFYLVDLDLWIELTTMKQSLVTEKNRKVRRLRELYPDVNIRLLYKKDYLRLLARYGYGPLGAANGGKLGDVLLSAEDIAGIVADLGRRITEDYAEKAPVLIGLQRGMVCFMADLMRQIHLPIKMDFMSIATFGGGVRKSMEVVKDLVIDLQGEHVILVEEIVDTGITLDRTIEHLKSKGPASVEVCALLDKRARRLADTPIKYVGFEAPDEFLVGYGLDFGERFRNLPFVAVYHPEEKKE